MGAGLNLPPQNQGTSYAARNLRYKVTPPPGKRRHSALPKPLVQRPYMWWTLTASIPRSALLALADESETHTGVILISAPTAATLERFVDEVLALLPHHKRVPLNCYDELLNRSCLDLEPMS